MPLSSGYNVLIGRFHDFMRDPMGDFGSFYHGHVLLYAPFNGKDQMFSCAVDVKKPAGSFSEYFHVTSLEAAKFIVVPGLSDGRQVLAQNDASGALDYVRHPMITLPAGCSAIISQLIGNITGNPPEQVWKKSEGDVALDVLETMVRAPTVDKVYVFGEPFGDGSPGNSPGMHNVHQNQGDPIGSSFADENWIWQDGAVIVRHTDGRFEGFFLKFSTQSLKTNDQGQPI